MNDFLSTPLTDEFHDEPGEIVGGAAALNFAPANGERPLRARTFDETRPSGRVVRRLEISQVHPDGHNWSTLEIPIDPQGLLDLDLEFKARIAPAARVYVMAYSEDGSHEVGRLEINQHEAVYRLSGALPFKLLNRPWRLGFTLPGNSWFAFQIWDIELTWLSAREG